MSMATSWGSSGSSVLNGALAGKDVTLLIIPTLIFYVVLKCLGKNALYTLLLCLGKIIHSWSSRCNVQMAVVNFSNSKNYERNEHS